MRTTIAQVVAMPAILAVACAAAAGGDGSTSATTAGSSSFEARVLPLLTARCVKCHGADKAEGGLDLRRRSSLLKGGESGPAIVPGKPDESLLLEKIHSGEMPPKPEKRVGPVEESLIRAWIAAGAPGAATDPAADLSEPAPRVSSEDRKFWAFRPAVEPRVPRVVGVERVRNPIDAFVLSKLEGRGLSFNAEAPKSVLARRACFDLLGLPPTLEQLDEFLRDDSPDAYERLVERLLASPQYGERWARHWLDVAGYADSDGYLDADRERPEAWRYRDYVIDAYNGDLPFDRFVLEQLAGDELSGWRIASRLTPEMARQLTATGFLRTCLDPTYPGYTEPNEIHQVLSDTLQIVSSAFLGLTVQCARCHAHKTDPVSQHDYYALQAVFLPALDPARWQPSGLRGIPLATPDEQAHIDAHNRQIDEQIAARKAALERSIAALRTRRAVDLFAAARAKGAAPADSDAKLVERLVAAAVLDPKQRSPEQRRLLAGCIPEGALSETSLAKTYPNLQAELTKQREAIAQVEATRKSVPLLRSLADLSAPHPSGRILKRGNFRTPGARVDADVPAVLARAGSHLHPRGAVRGSGRRTALAQWLIDPSHPLTARVQVNRIWAGHFGRGIVATSANFGRSGSRPSHPELLDWLAVRFVRDGWSVKELHRRILCSTTYRQSADADPVRLAADPDNVLLGAWQPRRFEGEVLRDSVLAVAGALNPAMLGQPVPVLRQPDGSVLTAEDASAKRRSIYLKVRRSQHLTMLDLFDTPVMEINCPERSVSTVPLQALVMLHGPFAEHSAAALANRIVRSGSTDDARLDFACRLLYARAPKPVEREAVLAFLKELPEPANGSADSVRAAWTQAALVLLNSNAFVYVE